MRYVSHDSIIGLRIKPHKSSTYKMAYMHYHDAYELAVLEKGDRSYIVKDRLIALKPRDVILINKNLVHCSVSGEYTISQLEFSDEYLSNFFSEHGTELITRCFEKMIIRVNESDFDLLLSYIERLHENNDDIWAFVQILDILNNKTSRLFPDFRGKNSKIADAIDYITENYKAINNLDDICTALYISKQHLCDIFKETTGTTIIKYINELKIHASLELLNNKNLSIEEIAIQCGFSSSSYFSKIFKRLTGVSPVQYRKLKSEPQYEPILT